MVSIAQVLARDPQLVLFDEPTSNLNLQRQLEVLDLLRSVTAVRKIITLISLHDLNLAARFAAHFVVITEGLIYASGDAACVLTPGMLCGVYHAGDGHQLGSGNERGGGVCFLTFGPVAFNINPADTGIPGLTKCSMRL